MAVPGVHLCIIIFTVLWCSLPTGAAMELQWNTLIAGTTDIAIADDGSRVIAGTNTGYAVVFDEKGSAVWEKRVPGSLLVGCVGNGEAFVLVSRELRENNKGGIRYFDGNGSQQWLVNAGWVTALAVSGTIAAGNAAGDLVVLDSYGDEVAGFNDFPKSYSICTLALSDDGKYGAYANAERNPQVKYITIGSRSKKVFSRPYKATTTYVDSDPIRQVAISGDGAYVATAGGDGSRGPITLYSKGGTLLWQHAAPRTHDLVLNGNGSCIFTAGEDGYITCYDRAGDVSWAYDAGAPVRSIDYARGRGVLAAGTAAGELFLFNEDGDLLWRDRVTCFPTGAISRVVISRDGEALVVLANMHCLTSFVEVSARSLPAGSEGCDAGDPHSAPRGDPVLRDTVPSAGEPPFPGANLFPPGNPGCSTPAPHAMPFPGWVSLLPLFNANFTLCAA